MRNLRIIGRVLLLLTLVFTTNSCNKQKAEALKMAAEQFRSDASLALDKMSDFFYLNISAYSPSESDQVDFVIKKLHEIKTKEEINAGALEFFSSSMTRGQGINQPLEAQLEDLKTHYYQFEAMFINLDKGSYLAKDAVSRAEKNAIELSIQMIELARLIAATDFIFAAKRQALIQRMKEAKGQENVGLRDEMIKNVANDFVQLHNEEMAYKEETVRHCLRAAESGRMVAELIKDYGKMKVSDVIQSVRESLEYGITITEGNEKLKEVLTKFDGYEKAIMEDPHWKVLLEKEIPAPAENESPSETN